MSGPFKIGDRVRLTACHRQRGYCAGDMGTVIAVMPAVTSDKKGLYQVRVDGKDEALNPSFYADELEPE
jgi:hypothetical protein